MGDMADYIIDQAEYAWFAHQVGECEDWCQHCWDEMTPEEQEFWLK